MSESEGVGAAAPAPTLSAALELVIAGWELIPLDGKIPLTGHGLHDATCDPGVVRSWWERWPHANPGAAVPLTLLVLDIDPRNGGDIRALGPLPETLTVWSGRNDGGRHLYFLRPTGSVTGRRLPDGIDLKVRGYCVMPPSLHPATGQPYRWEEHPPVALPPHLREQLRPPPLPPRHAGFKGSGKGLVEFVARQAPGNRNNALFWAACRAADEGVLDSLTDDLLAAAVEVGESETAALNTIESARRRD